jgi:hypothetical protein
MANLDELIDGLAREAVALKPAPQPFKLWLYLLLAALLYLAVCLGVSGLRPDAAQAWQQPWLRAEIGLLFMILLSGTLSAALLSFPDLGQHRALVRLPAWLCAGFGVLLYFSWRSQLPPAPLPAHDYQCTLCITLVALAPASAMLWIMRQYACTHYRAAGSIALLSAFSIGALWLRLHEVNNSIVHVLQWHYLPMLAVGLIGLCLGRALLKW